MDVRTAVLCSFLLVSCYAKPMVVDDFEETTKDPEMDLTTAPLTTTTEAPSIAKNCTTARHVYGTCVVRGHCEYSTTAIDLTLYATKDYVKPCKLEEVCCPFEFVVPEGESSDNLTPHSDDDSAFEFDDDD